MGKDPIRSTRAHEARPRWYRTQFDDALLLHRWRYGAISTFASRSVFFSCTPFASSTAMLINSICGPCAQNALPRSLLLRLLLLLFRRSCYLWVTNGIYKRTAVKPCVRNT